MGPVIDSPSAVTQNLYQLVNNLTWNIGARPEDRLRADVWKISSMDQSPAFAALSLFESEPVPDRSDPGLAHRNVGGKPYLGNAMSAYGYANDNWKVTRRLTVNIGARWEYNGVAKSMKEFGLNSAADVPGVITLRAPKAQL